MKETRIPRKNCGREFLHRMPLALYEVMLEAAKEDGEELQLAGNCPTCQEGDPFFRMMNGMGIKPLDRYTDISRSLNEQSGAGIHRQALRHQAEDREPFTKFTELEAMAMWSSLSKSIVRYQDGGDRSCEYRDGAGSTASSAVSCSGVRNIRGGSDV